MKTLQDALLARLQGRTAGPVQVTEVTDEVARYRVAVSALMAQA